MKKHLINSLFAAIAVLFVLSAPVFAAQKFDDVPDDAWFAEYVYDLADQGILNGVTDTAYVPEAPVTRGQFVKILAYASGEDLTPYKGTTDFTDCTNHWAVPNINWAYENGIVKGVGVDRLIFNPDGKITRQEIATMISRYADYKGYTLPRYVITKNFDDEGEIASWARDAVIAMERAGIINGYNDSTFRPEKNATRAEAAKLISVFIQKVTDEAVRNVVLENFKSDKDEIYLNKDEIVTFSVKVNGNGSVPNHKIQVMDDKNRVLGYMNDAGVDGDKIAGDDIYSCQAKVKESEIKTIVYHAELDRLVSENFEILFYRDLTQEEFVSFSKLMNSIADLSFYEAKNYIANSGEIKSYEIDESHKTISYQSVYGIYGLWEGELKSDTKGSGEFAIPASQGIDYTLANERIRYTNITSDLSNKNILVLRPFRSTEFKYDDFKSAGTSLKNALGGNLSVMDDGSVTVDLMKSVGDYGIVLIDSHGTLNKSNPFMIIGEELNEEKFLWDPIYYAKHIGYTTDYLSGRIYCVSFKNDEGVSFNRIAIGGKFFDKYLSKGSLDDSLYYLGTCYSMYNNSIADVLLKKGADAVIGFSNPVTTGYCNNVLFEVLVNSMVLSAENLCGAISDAKVIYGSRDPHEFENEGIVTELRYTGDDTYKIVDSISAARGTLSGKISNASDRTTPVSGASIGVYQGSTCRATLISDSNGNYKVTLPAGNYRIQITAPGYIPFDAYATVAENGTTYMETFLMIKGTEGERGTANGIINNAVTGSGLGGVALSFRSGWNNTKNGNVVATAVTDSNGAYSVMLPIGNYTMYCTKEGFVPTTVNIVVQTGNTSSQNGSMSPVISGSSYRIVLTWGNDPQDLDSHIEGKLMNGDPFHVYFGNGSQSDGDVEFCKLDVDDRSGYGPETITLDAMVDQPYYYYIHNYSGSGPLIASGAQIKVYQGESLKATFNVPTDQADGAYWNVFAIDNGKIVKRNTITSEEELNYISK